MDGPIKIGCSYLPARRLIALSHWSPFDLEIIAVAPGDFATERALHDHFKADLTRREWFRSSPELLACIRALSAGASLETALAARPMQRAA